MKCLLCIVYDPLVGFAGKKNNNFLISFIFKQSEMI